MPSLLPPSTSNPNRTYTPLADEINPPFGSHAPTVTRNGTVVYGRRSSYGSDTTDVPTSLVFGPDDGVSSQGRVKGKQRAMNDEEDDGDVGQIRRSGTIRSAKGKERAWDEEMGEVEHVNGSYPPVNEVEDEERRIQENLAKFAARDMARRRAARLSRIMPSSPGPAPAAASSSTTSFMRRPFSMISNITGGDPKRSSVMGVMNGWMQSKDELPLTNPTDGYLNPYEPNGHSSNPKMTVSPPPPQSDPSPFADPAPPSRPGHRASGSMSPVSPTQDLKYGYVGPQWRGGAGAMEIPQNGADDSASLKRSRSRVQGGERWWHALCAWGADLDGGHGDEDEGGNQAGRTNPFE